MGWSRRAALRGAGALCLAACGDHGKVEETGAESQASLDSSPACDPPVPDPADPAWVEVPLADVPELAAVGGQALLSRPDALLEVVLAQPTAGCYLAIWRICTHGACEVAWEAEAREVVCPCHGSRFGEDGQVLEGPATVPLATFPIALLGESLWVYRPV